MSSHMGDRGARWYNNPLAKNSVEHVARESAQQSDRRRDEAQDLLMAAIIAGLIESGEREKHGGNMVHLYVGSQDRFARLISATARSSRTSCLCLDQ